MKRFQAFRNEWAGTIQDIAAALAMLAFLIGAGLWLAVL